MSIFKRITQNSTKFRIAIGLCSITVTLMLIGAFIGLVPNHQTVVNSARATLAETVAANGTLLITQ